MPNAFGYTSAEIQRVNNAVDLGILGVLSSVAVIFVAHNATSGKDKVVRIVYDKIPMTCFFRGNETQVKVNIDRRIPKDKRKKIADIVVSDRMMNLLYQHVIETAGYDDYTDAYLEPNIDVFYEPDKMPVKYLHLKIAYLIKGYKYNTTRYIYDIPDNVWTDKTRF